VAASVRAGQPVELHDRAGELPPPTARVVYRIVQEGLTNAHKHAPGAATTVSLDRDGEPDDPRGVTVLVRNEAGARAPAERSLRSDHVSERSLRSDHVSERSLRSDHVSERSARSHQVADAAGSGAGLLGLAERIRLVGGSLRSGPAGRNGWEIHAAVPWLDQHPEGDG
jgi:signal transduction histidine kinase